MVYARAPREPHHPVGDFVGGADQEPVAGEILYAAAEIVALRHLADLPHTTLTSVLTHQFRPELRMGLFPVRVNETPAPARDLDGDQLRGGVRRAAAHSG